MALLARGRPRQKMNLYLDDDCAKGALVTRLRNTGHHIVLPADVSLGGAADPRHFLYAVRHGLVLLTRNHDDFEDLHLLVQATQGRHTGILAIRFDNDPTRDMKDTEIVRAIRNLEQSGAPIGNEYHILNHWR
jgi:predicted nuclease of predicted toxin-antitoxin system